MTVRDSSIEAFKRQVRTGDFATQAEGCLACVVVLGSAPRREIARRTGYEISAVCGAVNKLLADCKLMDWRRVDCAVTGRSVHLVELYDRDDLEPLPETPGPATEPVQGELLPIPAFLR